MISLDFTIFVFVVLESANVVILYFFPEFAYGNSMRVFQAWSHCQEDERTRLFAKYMANWVAGTKLIFIALLVGVLAVGGSEMKAVSVGLMIPAIGSYYFMLRPLIEQMDRRNELNPTGYAKQLTITITVIILGLAGTLAYWFASGGA